MENRTFLERYRLSLGRNGLPVELHRSPTARTYRAQEIETGREVALTLISPAPSDPAVLERLQAEAVAAETINHLNIPRLSDFGLENGELIYVSEYSEGHTASAWVGARGPLSTAAVLRVALQVVDAMNATAFQHLCHPALNPDNIVFVAGQTMEGDWPPIKVLHWFGPAPDLSGTADARSESAARFAAPEQLSEGKVDVRSEIYALGATMWFLLTGAPPAAVGLGGAKPELSTLRGAPKIVRHLLGRMLRHHPSERPQDPVALANYLQTCLARVERRTKIERRFGIPVTTQARIVEKKARIPIPIVPVALAAAVLMIAAFAVLFLHWSISRNRLAPVTTASNRVPPGLPNEMLVVTKNSLGRLDASGQNLPPAAVAVAPAVAKETAQDKSTSTSGVTPAATPMPAVASESGSSEMPRDEFATTKDSPAEAAPPAPEEGPNNPPAVEPAMAATQPERTPIAVSSPDEQAPEPVISQPNIAEANEVGPASGSPEPVAIPTVAEERASNATLNEKPQAERHKTLLAKHSSTKRKPEAVAGHSRIYSKKKLDQMKRTAKRAQPLPKLRVGSAPAELVGTTRDGKWILSVADTGQKVIVPPPPGYGQ